MDLGSTLDAYNGATSQQPINYVWGRGGPRATLPRLGRDVNGDLHGQVEGAGVALLCEEARLAIVAGLSEEARGAVAAELALLEAGLRELLGELEESTTL
jgi:hypothetical protein